MGSYRDIMRGPELNAEYEKFQAYQRKDREAKQALYKTLGVSKFTYTTQIVYIAPFSQPAKAVFVGVEICAAGTASPGSVALDLASGFFATVAPAGANDIVLQNSKIFPKGKLAKMIVKQRGALLTEEHKSRITGRTYKRYANNSVSVFLGKGATSDDYADVIRAIKIKAAYETFVGAKGNTIQFIPEG